MRRSQRSHSQSISAGRARALAAGALVALLGGIGLIVTSSGSHHVAEQAAPEPVGGSPTATVAAPAKTPSSVTIDVAGIGAYDPAGDGTENDGDARLATDGNAATAWKSERYRSVFAKPGVGLVIDAGRPVKASRVMVVTDTPGFTAQVQAGSAPEGLFVAVSSTRTLTARTVFALKPRRARYLVLWITSMPEGGAAAVNELTVRAVR